VQRPSTRRQPPSRRDAPADSGDEQFALAHRVPQAAASASANRRVLAVGCAVERIVLGHDLYRWVAEQLAQCGNRLFKADALVGAGVLRQWYLTEIDPLDVEVHCGRPRAVKSASQRRRLASDTFTPQDLATPEEVARAWHRVARDRLSWDLRT